MRGLGEILLCLAACFLIGGCATAIVSDANDPTERLFPLTADEIKFLKDRGTPTRLDDGEIERIVSEAVALLEDSGTSTRAGSEGVVRTVRGIRPFVTALPDHAAKTSRGIGSVVRDTLFHIVDFHNERGYCIVAADRRIPDEIICFVGHGSFPDITSYTGQRTENPGLRFMIDVLLSYADRHLARHVAWCDSVEAALLARANVASTDQLPESVTNSTRTTRNREGMVLEPAGPSWHFNRRVEPMLPVEWDQSAPFNRTVVSNSLWATTPVGCVALAAAGIMAYWGHPVQYGKLDSIDWAELTRWSGSQWQRTGRYRDWDGAMSDAPEDTRRLIADLLWQIGQDIDMVYGSAASYAYTYKATDLLAELGFSETTSAIYSKEAVLRSIDAGRPVIIEGASHMTADGSSYANEHAWIIDGYLEQRWWDLFVIDHHLYEIEQFRGFFHNNFGWGGVDNGYYACGLFDANNDADIPSDGTDTRATWVGHHYNYQFILTVYPDIYKK